MGTMNDCILLNLPFSFPGKKLVPNRCLDRQTVGQMYRETDKTVKMLICFPDCVQVVQMVGTVRDVTVAVAVCMTLLAITSLESVPAVQDGRDSGAANVSY